MCRLPVSEDFPLYYLYHCLKYSLKVFIQDGTHLDSFLAGAAPAPNQRSKARTIRSRQPVQNTVLCAAPPGTDQFRFLLKI